MREESPSHTLRLTIITILIIGLFAALFSRLWFLQVLAGDRYSQLAEENRVRFVVTEAPRGRILDRHGNAIVKSRPALTVSADKRRLLNDAGVVKDAQAKAVLTRLSRILEMPKKEILDKLHSRKYSPFRPVPIKVDVAPETIFHIQERKELYRGVTTQTLPVRTYPHGDTAAHVVGTIGEISDEELQQPVYKDYWPGDLIGKSGLEAAYEEYLQGREGRQRLEVNAQNTVQDVLETVEPVRGDNVKTSLDLRLQKDVERVLLEGLEESRGKLSDGEPIESTAGAVVVLDPDNGQVIAMASYPTYEPGKFVGGVPTDYFNDVYRDVKVLPDDDGDGQPQVVEDEDPQPKASLNRAIQAAHPPGSTFKIITAAAALSGNLMTQHSTLPCPPEWGPTGKNNWNNVHEGQMDIARALKRSCDTVFYELGHRAWVGENRQAANSLDSPDPEPVDELVQGMARQFGLGSQLGIDLPGESAGTIPTFEWIYERWVDLRDYWCQEAEEATPGSIYHGIMEENCTHGWQFSGGDAANLSIGQGDVTTTPLQMATAFSAIANGGTVWRPHLGVTAIGPDDKVVERFEKKKLGQLPLDQASMQEIQLGLEQVVMDDTFPSGTASAPFDGFPLEDIPVAGKTGTAQSGTGIPYAWFAAYAPADDPQFVAVAMVEEGGGGSVTAAPIVRSVLEAAFQLDVTDFETGPETD